MVVVLYLGDYDPSGVDIERFVREATYYFGLDPKKVVIRRVAVLPEQVIKYNLPPEPKDAETLAKLGRDPRSKKYALECVVELDALVVYAPREFKETLRHAIKEWHDEETYMRAIAESERIRRKCREIIEEAKKEALRKIIEEARKLME